MYASAVYEKFGELDSAHYFLNACGALHMWALIIQ